MQSIASRLSVLFLLLAWQSIRAVLVTLPCKEEVGCYFSVCEDGLFATDGGAVCTARLQIVVYCVTHGELSHSCLCPVDKGIGSCFSCLAVLVVCHDSDVLSLLKKFDTYPNGDFNQDDCPTYKSQAEHPGIGATVEVCTLLDIADSFEFLLLVSEQCCYPLLKLIKGLLEGRNGGVVPLVQL